MNNYIIKKYIKNLSKNDIYNLALKNNINLNQTELDKLYKYIQNNYLNYFNNTLSLEQILYDSKIILETNNYIKLSKLYDEYKDKI